MLISKLAQLVCENYIPTIIHQSPINDIDNPENNSHLTLDDIRQASINHIQDVRSGLNFFKDMLSHREYTHDDDKLDYLDIYHKYVTTGDPDWLDLHYKNVRHHLYDQRGIPRDINLIDILEYIVDYVVDEKSGAESGEDPIDPSLLKPALDNTITLLKRNLRVE